MQQNKYNFEYVHISEQKHTYFDKNKHHRWLTIMHQSKTYT